MKSFLVLCIALVAFEITHAAVISPGIFDYNGCGCGYNSFGCGCNNISPCSSAFLAPALSPYSPIIDFPSCSNNIIAPIIPSCSNTILAPAPSCSNTVISAGIPSCSSSIVGAPSNVIVQPSVASSLADTLSLLTVSSLLADTLPYAQSVVVPSCGCGCGCGLSYGGYYY